ncbi:hypothetical protein L6164_022204 [Bauhinia variegata]|uniref:Uncharacterized protein n=1 Tax=Bauhinia variegata TaxID=167791 RepID=A0ACB9MFT7_BAUVA|nr:hypothetical protein L6164_022204 [Bauhinia variegata]
MANLHSSLPSYERLPFKFHFQRVMDTVILILLLLLLGYRLISFTNSYTFACFLAFLCETWFTITWLLTVSTKWTPALIKTYPERLFQRVSESELPPVDLFVTTADHELEPPIITVNTVLSLLALDYPAHKLACYVSDDGCSPLTFYALVEASKFAKLWVPFCKKYNVQTRAPYRCFSDKDIVNSEDSSPEFKQEWLQMKGEYEKLSHKIAAVSRKPIPFELDREFAVFSDTERRNHSTIIKVIWENKENGSDELPHLIYISREKRPKQPHHYKAGAMNVLTRVSGLMTNAPFTLNVDCDMSVNNPKIVLHALCVLLDPKGEKEVAFVQCPQQFCNGLKDDPFGNQMVVLFTYLGAGIAGIQGPFYSGTNCLHRRKVIYGLSSDHDIKHGKLPEKELLQTFGSSIEFNESAAEALGGKSYSPNNNISKSLEAASKVAGYGYESGTAWGKQVGWKYGSTAEDTLTGLKIHTKGWKSEMITPEPIAFTGSAPMDVPSSMSQQKRWTTGLLEIFFSKSSPIFATLFGKLQFRQCLAYVWIMNWGLRSVPEICYAVLPAYCIITNSNFLPKDIGLCVAATLFVIYNIYTLTEYYLTGMSIRAWWNNQRMTRIFAMNPWIFGFLRVMLKLLKLSETVFEVTRKEQPSYGDGDCGQADSDAGRFTFDESHVFVPGTTILLLQLIALVIKFLGLQPPPQSGNEAGIGVLFCSIYLVVCYWPFLKGLFGKGKYGIPISTVSKSAALAFLFVHLCTGK